MRTRLGGLLAGLLLAGCAGAYAGPAATQLLTPAVNSTITARRPTFTWSAVSGAEWYHLWIQHDRNYYL